MFTKIKQKVRRRTQKDFQKFLPREYLDEYYGKIDHENHSLLEFFVDAYGNVRDDAMLLEFGGGPTIYQLITAANKVKEIHFADYLDDNINEVKKWHQRHPQAFDWSEFFHKALELEGHADPHAELPAREELLRLKMTKFMKGDAHQVDPVGAEGREQYDVLSVHFVPESITDSKEIWRKIIGNITTLLKPGGTLIMSALTEASHWRAGPHVFPATYITTDNIVELLTELGYDSIKHHTISAEVVDENSPDFVGYKGMVFISAVKKLKKP